MSAQHTPGRLRLFDTYVDPEIRDDNEKLVAVVLAEKANSARRLVACWNACEMVSTEDLEALTRPGDVSWACTIDRVARERDELLAALNMLKAWDFGAAVVTAEDEKRMDGVAAFARAAIAKVGGEA